MRSWIVAPGPKTRFLAYNAAGGIVWAAVFGLGGYVLGDNVHRLTGPVGIGGALLGAALALTGVVWLRRNERRLADDAERALPGPFGGSHPHGDGRPAVETAITAAPPVKARRAEAKG